MDLALKKSAFVGSVICFVYFSALILISYYQLEYVLIGVVVELVSIPLLLMLVSVLILSGYLWYKDHLSVKSRNLYSLLINMLTTTMLVLTTLSE